MDLDTAFAHLRDSASPLRIELPTPDTSLLDRLLERFEQAGARRTGDTRSVIEMGRLQLEAGLDEAGIRLTVARTPETEAELRILFRIMAGAGRLAGEPATLIGQGDRPLFRYDPGGPGLSHLASGERVTPYDQ